MRPLPRIAAGLLAGLVLAGCATPTHDTGPRDMAQDIDALMRDYTGHVPGASVLVVRDGVPIVRRSYGYADLDAHVPATPATNYRLASVSKQFTAASILLLMEDGRLRLDDPVRHWLPTLPEAVDAVTLRHLLTHTAGLIDYEDVMDPASDVQVHDADVLALLEGQPRTYFPPGSDYRYSNSGYALLSLVVERASGMRYADFLHARIFEPLGMQNTVAFEAGRSTVAHRAYGHTFQEGRWMRTDQSTTSAVLGDGGVYSSIDDLVKWDAAIRERRLLQPATWAQAFTPATKTDEADVQYGFGWRVTGETLWHSGETVGLRNVIVRYPARKLTVVVLTNRNAPEPYATAKKIAALYLD